MEYIVLIKELRKKLVISQKKLTSLLDFSFASINRWKSGHHGPTIKIKRKILKLCKKN